MPTIEECQRLFEEHLPWAHWVARRVHSQLPPSFPVEDLEQEAALELWNKIQKYDPAKNDNVRGYAYLAVRGAVLMTCRRKWYREATNDEIDAATPAAAASANPAEQYQIGLEDRAKRRRELRQLQEIARRLRAFPARMQFAAYLVRRVHLEGAGVPEVARTTGVAPERLQRVLAAGLRMLKRK